MWKPSPFVGRSRGRALSAGRSAVGSDEGQLDATILGAALRRVVRSNRVRVAKSLRRDQLGLYALRDQERHHVFSTLLRQDLVRGDPLPLQRATDRGIVGKATDQELVLLRRRQFRRHFGDDVLSPLAHLIAARRE